MKLGTEMGRKRINPVRTTPKKWEKDRTCFDFDRINVDEECLVEIPDKPASIPELTVLYHGLRGTYNKLLEVLGKTTAVQELGTCIQYLAKIIKQP